MTNMEKPDDLGQNGSCDVLYQELKTQMNQIILFQKQFVEQFQLKSQEFETNDYTLGRKIDEILTLLGSQNKNFNSPQLNSNCQKLHDFVQNCENVHSNLINEENSIAEIYNEILDYPVLLNKVDITRHHRILSKALELNPHSFNYEKFIKFIFESISKYQNYETQSLLVYFDETDFGQCSHYIDQLKQNQHFKIEYLQYREDRYWNLFDQFFDSHNLIKEVQNQLQLFLQNQLQNQEEAKEIKKQNEKLLHENEELKKLNTDMLSEIKHQNSQFFQDFQNYLNNEIKSNQKQIDPNSHFEELQRHQSTLLMPLTEINLSFHKRCHFSSDSSFDGVLNYLHNNGEIQLKSGAPESSEAYKVTNIIEYSNTNPTYYAAKTDANTNFIEFDFVNSKIDLSSYQIQSYPFSPMHSHPKTWEIKGSNDQQTWDPLDRRENCGDLNGKSLTKHFLCQTPNHKCYRYIRYYQTENWTLNQWIEISRFELYGDIYKS